MVDLEVEHQVELTVKAKQNCQVAKVVTLAHNLIQDQAAEAVEPQHYSLVVQQ